MGRNSMKRQLHKAKLMAMMLVAAIFLGLGGFAAYAEDSELIDEEAVVETTVETENTTQTEELPLFDVIGVEVIENKGIHGIPSLEDLLAKSVENGTVQEISDEAELSENETEIESEAAEETELIFENGEVIIRAVADADAELPEGTTIEAVKLEEGSEEYEEMKALSEQATGPIDTAEYIFYNVCFFADGEEFEPAEGTVTVQIQFKNVKVDSEAEVQKVLHIEDNTVEDVTAQTAEGSNMSSVDFDI